MTNTICICLFFLFRSHKHILYSTLIDIDKSMGIYEPQAMNISRLAILFFAYYCELPIAYLLSFK